MTLQKSVLRQYTQGFVGEIAADGPRRGKPAILVQNAPAGVVVPNRIGRAFTFANDIPAVPSTGSVVDGSAAMPWIEHRAIVGKDAADTAPRFYGILGIPKHFTLYGNVVDGPLGPTYDIPANTEAELLDMAIMNVSISNGSATAAALGYGLPVYACIGAGTTGNGAPTGTRDMGRLYVFPVAAPDADALTRFMVVPNCITTTTVGANVTPATATLDTGEAIDANAVVVRIQLTN